MFWTPALLITISESILSPFSRITPFTLLFFVLILSTPVQIRTCPPFSSITGTIFSDIFSFYNGTSRASRGYPGLKIFKERPRESTDLEEYIIIEPKNIVQLQKFKKLWRAPFGEKREDFFFFTERCWGAIPDSPD